MTIEKKQLDVTIFDDSNEVRYAVFMLINSSKDFRLTGGFGSATDCIENLAYSKPDIVLMDIEMPGLNGIKAVKMIKEKFPDMIIIMQSGYDDNEKVFESICNGASGYILKKDIADKLLDYLQEIKNGGAPMSPSIAMKVLNRMKEMELDQKPVEMKDYNLTQREREVLTYIYHGFSHKQITEKMFISYDTVRSHVKKIYEKLHVASKTEAMVKVKKERILLCF